MVEKIKRDVRITTIYEGTSEIMEITVSRDRWQQHLKSRGQHYHEQAGELEALAGRDPRCGADVAALALHALAETMEQARKARLTRNQHVLLRLGEVITHVECAASLARRAAGAADHALPEKADRRFQPEALAALSRVYARETALRVVDCALRWVAGADGVPSAELGGFERSLGLPAIHRGQAGLLADMDLVADALYDR
jgi:alkylation response protein AidB-like acyl-CoA dehydrogenase